MTQTNLYQTILMEPAELLDTVMCAGVDYSQLAGADTKNEVAELLEGALPLIAQAWNLPQETLTEAQQVIQKEHSAMLHEAKTGEHTPCSLPRDKVLQGKDGNEIMEVIWSIFETAVRTESTEQKKHLLATARFLNEFWDMDEWIKK